MTEIHVPLVPLGMYTNLWGFASGRLNGNNAAQVDVTILPPDGVFLQTLRIKGFLGKSCSFSVKLYRTQKDNFTAPPIDLIASETITTTPTGVVNHSLPLAPSGKSVVDNSVYNYSFFAIANTTGPTDLAFISEIALLY